MYLKNKINIKKENSNNNEIMDKIQLELTLISSVVLTVIGLFGNLLVVYILRKPQFSNKSIFRYLVATSINNCLVLMTLWPYTLSGVYVNFISSISCKFIQYFGYLFYLVCPGILVINSIDRLISVKYPTRYKFRKRKKFQLFVLLTIFICMIILNIPFYLYNDVNTDNPIRSICSITDPHIKYNIDQIFSLITLFIPFIITVLSMVLIRNHLSLHRNLFLQNRKKLRQKIEIIKLTFAINIFYLICNAPYWIQEIIFDLYDLNGIRQNHSNIIFLITNYFTYVQNSLTFFIFVFFNKKFRSYVSLSFSNNRIEPQ